jgi:hypothetical protein
MQPHRTVRSRFPTLAQRHAVWTLSRQAQTGFQRVHGGLDLAIFYLGLLSAGHESRRLTTAVRGVSSSPLVALPEMPGGGTNVKVIALPGTRVRLLAFRSSSNYSAQQASSSFLGLPGLGLDLEHWLVIQSRPGSGSQQYLRRNQRHTDTHSSDGK